MRCKKCQEAGTPSKVYVGQTSTTTMYCAPWYDEHGFYHNHDTNRATQMLSCSNGHRWTAEIRNTCACGWVQQITGYVYPENTKNRIVHYKDGQMTAELNDGTFAPVTCKTLTDDELIRYY